MPKGTGSLFQNNLLTDSILPMKNSNRRRNTESLRYKVSLDTVHILKFVADHPLHENEMIVFDKSTNQSLILSRREWDALPVDFDLALRHQMDLLEQKLKVVKALQEQSQLSPQGARIRYLNAWN